MNADAELIARVLDGRATADERARVLAEADRSPELLELLADSAAALGTGVDVISLESRKRGWPAMVGVGAALVAAAGLFFMWPRGGEIAAPPFPISITASDLGPARAGAGIVAVRGAAEAERVLQSVIVGSRLMDYQVLGADTARETAAIEIANALRAIPGGEVAAASFANGEALSTEVIGRVESLVDVRSFRTAGWLELIRLAAVAGDRNTLGSKEVTQALEQIAKDRGLSVTVRDLAARIGSETDPGVIGQLASQGLVTLVR